MTRQRPNQISGKLPAVRCAIYTRKSSEEGLEQEFNSLDAQRESGEAYIRSQTGEGWTCLADRYDDGGFTGGNMDRPALKRLMADIEAGKIDCVVVYKVDRLSRSLLDFARMMETFERHKVSFVSVTQQFNTASSMGRLVLNVLLSFAQFEREIISERTRDKIAATRRKGKWAGGHPILGYDVDPRGFRLVVNEDEATRVREIFALYLEHQSLIATVKAIDAREWVNKQWTTRKGKARGGKPFDKTSLFKLLTNVAYLGKVKYKSEVHAGEHEPIVDPAVWQRVQQLLARNGRTGGAAVRNKYGALLKGLLSCAPCGCTTRVTGLPHSRAWDNVITLVAHQATVDEVAAATLKAADVGIRIAKDDPALGITVHLLRDLCTIARRSGIVSALAAVGLPHQAVESTAALAMHVGEALSAKFEGKTSSDVGEMLRLSAISTLCQYAADGDLFSRDSESPTVVSGLRACGSAAGFGRLMQSFFAAFMGRFLKYHLERELPNHVGSGRRFVDPEEHNHFLQEVSRYGYSASRVIPTYATEWVSKAQWQGRMTIDDSHRFAAHALSKLAEVIQTGRSNRGS